MDWLEGEWRCSIWGGEFTETWKQATPGFWVGTGYHLKDSRPPFMEFMSIELTDSGAAMFIIPSRLSKQPLQVTRYELTRYELTQSDSKMLIFENPEHDFPSKITYEHLGSDAINCTISGHQDGEFISELFEFKRIQS